MKKGGTAKSTPFVLLLGKEFFYVYKSFTQFLKTETLYYGGIHYV